MKKTRIFRMFLIMFAFLLVGCNPKVEEEPNDDVVVEPPLDENLVKANSKYNEVVLYLNETLPNELFADYAFPNFSSDSNVSVFWLSSDANVLARSGIVFRQNEDKVVTVTAQLKCFKIDYTYTKDIIVKAVKFKDIANRPVTTAYLYSEKIRESDYEKLDIVNLSFAFIDNGVIDMRPLMSKKLEIAALRNAGVRVCLSVGGWGADGFSGAVSTSDARTKFINSIVNALVDYNFSGVDLDWEYPTTTAGGTITASPADTVNFTLFLRDLRIAMNEIDDSFILSIAVPGTAYGLKYYEMSLIHEYLDYIYLMTYDLIDFTNTETTKHHTALYNSQYSSGSIKSVVDAYKAIGVAGSKLIIGAAFYGHFAYVSGAGDGIGVNTPSGLSSSINYSSIYNTYLVNLENNKNVYFDDVAKATWYYDGNIFISYDDEVSLTHKCDYLKEESLGGIMFWEYGQDSTGKLLNTIYVSLSE